MPQELPSTVASKAPPALELVLPSSSSFEQHGALIDLAAPSPLTIHAANLAPTAGALRCKFSGGEAGWEAEVLAAFVHGGLASCPLPPVDAQLGTRSLSLGDGTGGSHISLDVHRGAVLGEVHIRVVLS